MANCRARRLHVGFDDPPMLAAAEANSERARDHCRRVRDEIRNLVESLPQMPAPDSSEVL